MAKMMMDHLTNDDIQLCIQLLKNIEIKLSTLLPLHKGKAFDGVYDSVIESDKIKSKKK